jgi:hypothetical protein
MSTSLPFAARCGALAALLASAALLGACEDIIGAPFLGPGGGGGGGGGGSPVSPVDDLSDARVEAVGMIIAVPSASGAITTSAQLAIFHADANGAAYIGGIDDPRIAVGNVEVPLLTTETGGVFVTNSVRAPALTWQPGETYRFRFSVVDQLGQRADFEQPVVAPVTVHEVETPNHLVFYAGEPVSLELFDMPPAGAVAVTPANDPASAIWTSFAFDGPETVTQSLNSLLGVSGLRYEIPGSAFPEPGRYRVEVHGYNVARSSDAPAHLALGSATWATAGRAVVLEIDVD